MTTAVQPPVAHSTLAAAEPIAPRLLAVQVSSDEG